MSEPQQKTEWEMTPRWVIEAKYRGVLQIIQAQNDWESKYPLLEKMIDSLLSQSNKNTLEEAVERIEKMIERERIEGCPSQCVTDALVEVLSTLQELKK